MREPKKQRGRSTASICPRLPLFVLGWALSTGPLLAQESPPEPDQPWRLSNALGTPPWFEIGGTIRGRYETFDEQFRGGVGGSERAWVTRSLVEGTLRDTYLSATVELMDSRAYDGVSDARLNTTIVNAAEVLQAYVAAEFTDALQPGDQLRVQAGRHTMDIGSRRLVARNRYRNTINAFTGVNAQWKSQDGTAVRAFYTYPVQRLPGDQAALLDNEIQADEERIQARFYGAHATIPKAALGMDAEIYAFGLRERDGADFNSRNRNLKTVGTRWVRPRKAGAAHWEVESVYQFGESPDDGPNTQDHSAQFHHLTLGYTFEGQSKTRAEGLFDYATGDVDPNDTDNNRFDTLFGARRFEFGPTGIFGAIARTNLVSPGLRVVTKPASRWELMLTHRFHYLASDTDAWVPAGLRDSTGSSGDHIGNLSEFRVRYDWIPKSVRIEFGAVYLSAGSFVQNTTPNGGRDSIYGYLQTNFTF